MHVGGVLELLVLVVAAASCAGEENDVVLPAAPSNLSTASVDPGLASGCSDVEHPTGRLRGRVYAIPLGTRALPEFQTLSPAGAICLDRLAVTERRGSPGFPGVRNRYEWFAVDLDGAFDVDHAGVFQFRLTSDDGARLFIDGALVIDNDGYHTLRGAEGAAELTAGPHRIAVPYWQGPGPMALTLEVARRGGAYRLFRFDVPLDGAAP